MKLLKLIVIISFFSVGIHSISLYAHCCDSTTSIGQSCKGKDCAHCSYKFVPRKCKSGAIKGPALLDASCKVVAGVEPSGGTCPVQACSDNAHMISDHTCDANGVKLPVATTKSDLCIDPTC